MKGPLASVGILLLSFSTLGQTNEWTKPTSGDWEEPFWSLGQLPGTNQEVVAVDNYGWKAVAIGANTTGNFPQSLILNNLLVDAPTNSLNTLLLNWAQLNVPLVVRSNLIVGTDGALVSHYSALKAANATIDGSASFQDYATEDFGQLTLRSNATVGLTNGTMTCSNLNFLTGIFTQSGGAHFVQNLELPQYLSNASPSYPYVSSYYLQGGKLVSRHLPVGVVITSYSPMGHPEYDVRSGSFWQTGGVHTNSEMDLPGISTEVGNYVVGSYRLDGGLLVSTSVVIYDGNFSQNGGTNLIQQLSASGSQDIGGRFDGGFELQGGRLVTSNVWAQAFLQTGGSHTVLNQLQCLNYELAGGNLVVSDLEMTNGGRLIVSSNGNLVSGNILIAGSLSVSFPGTISNAGIISVSGVVPATITLDTPGSAYLGKLQISTACTLGYSDGGTIRFADSHTLPWTGPLNIYPGAFSGHIFFGTNAQGLTAAQVAQVEFNQGGAQFSAALLPTGELVPLSATNQWTKPTSGNWEESYWSLGRLPGIEQGFILFDNPGWKALAIDPNTTANFPASVSMNYLTVDGPTNSLNTLLLNWAGLSVPLSVQRTLAIGTNGSLVSHHSAVQAGNMFISGAASLMDGSAFHAPNATISGSLSASSGATAHLDYVDLRGAINLTDATLNCSNLVFNGGTFNQTAGTNIIQTITLPEYFDYATIAPTGHYEMQGGTLISQQLNLGAYGEFYNGPIGFGTFKQTGGTHRNTSMYLQNSSSTNPSISYVLDGGWLISGSILNYRAFMAQNGGTNTVQELDLQGGHFELSAGELVTSNSRVGYYGGDFIQNGGLHIVQNQLQIYNGYPADTTHYLLAGGKLLTTSIALTGELVLTSSGALSNAATLWFAGRIDAGNMTQVQHLGQLQLAGSGTVDMHSSALGPPTNATVLRLADSHSQSWNGNLQIFNWGLVVGDHIFFGTNSQSLTAGQLAQIEFVANNTNYPAMLSVAGELVPNAATNQWTKPTDGSWEESYWSLGRLPALDQGFVLFNNPGSKSLTISQTTANTYPNSLSVNNLVVDAPTNALNTLVLNTSGANVPLSVQLNLTIGPNGAVHSQQSALIAPNVYNSGSLSLSNGSSGTFREVWLNPGSRLGLSGSSLTCSNLVFDQATLTQNQSTVVASNIDLPANLSSSQSTALPSRYELNSGTLIAAGLVVTYQTNKNGAVIASGSFVQSGGLHTNSWIDISGIGQYQASYSLQGGWLVADGVGTFNARFSQTGGTNIVPQIYMFGTNSVFNLSAGQLMSSVLIMSDGTFQQSGGTHICTNGVLIGYGGFDEQANYQLSGGTLLATNISVYGGALKLNSSGVVSNSGIFSLAGYYGYSSSRLEVDENTQPQHLGQLNISTIGTLLMHAGPGNPTNATVLQFNDSHTLMWTGLLQVTRWGAHLGDHLYFGTNAQGLSAAQVSAVQFIRDDGNTNSAKLLATGELVPAVPPPIIWTNSGQGLVLSWPGGYQLTTSTNIDGPYAPVPGVINGYTNSFTERQRYFRLQLPGP